MTQHYKSLRTGRRATHVDGFVWPEPGEWLEVEGPLEACRNGLHVADLRQTLRNWLSDELWTVEVDMTDAITLDGKTVVRRARLVEQLPWDERTARLFAADCAEHVLHLFEAERPDDRRPREAITAARAFARGEIDAAAWGAAQDAAWAAWAAAQAAARDAARDAAQDAARDAAQAAAQDAAWAAARDAARAAAQDAAQAAAWAAARDAEVDWQVATLAKALGTTP